MTWAVAEMGPLPLPDAEGHVAPRCGQDLGGFCTTAFSMSDPGIGIVGFVLDTLDGLDGITDVGKVDKRAVLSLQEVD
jgi:hypothetical protein